MAKTFDWGQYEEKPSNNKFNWEQYAEEGAASGSKETLGQKALRYGVKDPLVGLANLGHGLINAPHNLVSLFSKKLGEKIPHQRDFDYADAVGLPKDKDLADTLIQIAPELGLAVALPEARLGKAGEAISQIPKAGKYLKTALANALSQGGLAAAMAPENQLESAGTAAGITAPFSALSLATKSGSPALRMAAKLGIGGAGGALGYQAGKHLADNDLMAEALAALTGGLSYRLANSKLGAQRGLFEGVEKEEFDPVLQAAKRLGLPYLTPAEATGSPFLGAREGNLGKTVKGAKLRYQKGEERLSAEEDAINRLFDTVFDKEKLAPEVDRLYRIADKDVVSEKAIFPFRENEIYKAARTHAQNDPAFREELKGVPENTIQYQAVIKNAMDDMISKATKRDNKNEARILTNTKNKFVETLDKVSPHYKEARELAEREITRQNLEQIFNKKGMTGINMFKALNDKSKFKAFMNNLRNVPDAQAQLRDMRTAFKNLISVPTARTAAAQSRSSMDKERSTAQALFAYLKNILSGSKHDTAAIELITNPHWAKNLEELSKSTSKEKALGKFIELLSKAGAQVGADERHKPLEIELIKYNRGEI